MKKEIIFGLIIIFLFITGCSSNCESGLYTSNGKCCTYVCNTDCLKGYKEGTCNCECNTNFIDDTTDTNIDDLFDDSDNVKPPELPMP